MSKNAKKYARAIFNVVDLDSIEDALAQLNIVIGAMNKDREIHSSLASPLFSTDEKAKAVDVISGILNLSEPVAKFLKYVVSDGMAPLLPEITKRALILYQEKKKKAKATVVSAVEISQEMTSRLKVALEKLTAKDVDIEYINDPSLLGGFIVKVGSTMYDTSIKGQLRLLKDELVKG